MAPRTITEDTSLLTLWSEAIYYRSSLARDQLSKALSVELEPFLARVKDTIIEQLDKWAEEDAAQADCDGENYLLDGTVEQFAEDKIDALRAENPGWKPQDARESSEFQLYFKTGRPYDIIKLALEAELKVIQSFPQLASKEQSTRLQDYSKLFQEHINTGSTALTRRISAQASTAEHRSRQIEMLIKDFNELRMRHYEVLLKLAREKKKPRSWTEQFTRKSATPSNEMSANEARGRAQTLLGVLEARKITLTDAQRKILVGNRDVEQFTLWTSRVASVASGTELFM